MLGAGRFMEERKESTPSKKPTNSKKPQTGTYKKLNVVLAIVIIILFIIAAIRYEIIQFPDDSNGSNGNGNVQIILPLPTKGIINTHEHINDYYIMDEWLASQRQSNVSATIMVGSPNSTFWSKPKAPFITYLENNELIIKMAQDTNGVIQRMMVM